MKKILSLLIAFAMIMTTFGFGAVEVSAAEHSDRYRITKDKEEAEYKEGEALVVFKTSGLSPKKAAAEMEEESSDIEIESLWDFEVEQEALEQQDNSLRRLTASRDYINVALVKSSTKTTKQLIKELEANKNVEFAEPNYKIQALSNDTYFDYQWALGSTEGSTNVQSKWDKGITGSEEKVVAVVDTGVYYPHEDLKNSMWENTFQPDLKGDHGFDFVNGDSDPIDDNGHGTHCAGIINAAMNNEVGVSGIAPDTKIMALKILDYAGDGYISDEVSAYHYIYKAMRLGVNVVAVNNSWGGGGSLLFETLVNLVGEKGAVTVCAAGNESYNNDEEESYPVSIDSPYLLSVAASNENNELATFSNYGETTVDLAAPGADILSTVAYPSYNPTIYDADKQNQLSEKYTDFNLEEEGWNIVDEIQVLNPDANLEITTSNENSFGAQNGKSLKLSLKGMKVDESVTIAIPYELEEDYVPAKDSKRVSMMVKTKAPDSAGPSLFSYGSGLFYVVDQGKSEPEFDLYSSENEYIYGTYLSGEENYWNHLEIECGNYESEPEKDRILYIGVYAEKSGDFEIYLDDFGISKTTKNTEELGRYDFYNGTSMAAPHVTAAVALAADEYPEADALTLIGTVLSQVEEKETLKGKVATDGVLDFAASKPLTPRIGGVKVDIDNGQIIVTGSGFGGVGENDVKVNNEPADLVSKEDNKLVINDNGWINSIVNIEVTGAGKTVTMKDVYLVNGKAEYTSLDEHMLMFPSSEGILASGVKKMYAACSEDDMIYVANPADGKYMDFEEMFEVKATKYFKKDPESTAKYDFRFGKDMPFADGKLYNITSYSEIGVSESDEWEEDWSKDYVIDDNYGEEDDYYYEDFIDGAAFASQYKLMAFDVNTGAITNLGELPAELKKIEDWTMASYNGKLYVMGGYDYSTKSLSTKVMVYDIAKKKWSEGPALPEARAEGKAVQSGNSLVYTLGYGSSQEGVELADQKCPANLVLRNGKWTVSNIQNDCYYAEGVVTRNGVQYYKFGGTVSICKEGVLYAGIPTAGLGDTYTYDPVKDTYAGTKYNFIDIEEGNTFTGVMVGNTLYGYDYDDYCYKAVISNGQVKVSTAKKYTWGTVKGANKSYMPGTKATIKAVPNKGYYVKSFYLDGQKVNGTSKTIRVTKDQTAKVTFGKYVTKITLNKTSISLKKGSTFKLKATAAPSNATNKAVTYKSSNTKYATVSSTGEIKAKRAGVGKTVTITVTAKDGSKKTATCKVAITK